MRYNLTDVVRRLVRLRLPEDSNLVSYHIDFISTIRRIKEILTLSRPSSKILLIGDDDLISLGLFWVGYKNLWVIDVDEKLLNIIKKHSQSKIHTIAFDLKNVYKKTWPQIPSDFDLFVTDPPYSEDGLRIFVGVGIKALKMNGLGVVIHPDKRTKVTKRDPKKLSQLLQKFLLKNGCIIRKMLPHYQRSYHGTVSSLTVIEKIEEKEISIGKFTYSFY